MAKSNKFVINEELLRDPSKVDAWGPEMQYSLYKVGKWSFELPEEGSIERAEEAVYAWLCWWHFLKEREDGGAEA